MNALNSDIVLGLGGTVDFEIVWDSVVLGDLAAAYEIDESELSVTAPISSERDLVVSVLAFLESGAGGERFVASSGIVEQFAARFTCAVTLGGTGVRAGIAMATFGVASTQHLVSIDDTVRRLLPPGTAYVSSATSDTLDPHLIVQFPVGATVRLGSSSLVAARANRLIFSNDPPNQRMEISCDLGLVLERASVFLISGFNSMQDPVMLESRLQSIRRHLRHLPDAAEVFYEDAGFHRPELSDRVRTALLDSIDVYSLNEDEWQQHLGRRVDLSDPDSVLAALLEIRARIPARTLVIHTSYWALAFGEGADAYAECLESAITMASTRYRCGDGFTVDDFDSTRSCPISPEGLAVSAGLAERMPEGLVCLPGYRLDVEHPTTIGLGDSFVGGFVMRLAAIHRDTPDWTPPSVQQESAPDERPDLPHHAASPIRDRRG